MLNSVFVDKATGESVIIVQEDVNFYALDNGVRIKKDVFMKKYDQKQEIDPNSFFNAASADPLLNMAQQLRNMDTSKVSDAPTTGAQVKFIEPTVILNDNSLPPGGSIKQPQMEGSITLSPEEKKSMLEKWRREQPGAQIPEVQNRDWNIDDERLLNGDKPIEVKTPKPEVDPIQMMFKMFKSNYSVKLNVEIEENIPNPTFIAMVQENVEADAVEYYANLISDKLLKDPTKLKTSIYEQLKVIINKELGT
jgi:hypothetical protein